MIIGVPKEILKAERRVAALPTEVAEYVKLGYTVLVETGAGVGSLASDDEYAAAGAEIVATAQEVFDRADIIIKVKQPHMNEVTGKDESEMIREGGKLITFLHPATPDNHYFVKNLAARNIESFTMDGIPRISRAQAMDCLTSMSTITGYKAVIIAANLMPRFIPMVGTAIGATRPAKVLVVGAGVVGLQAVATAKRLGAIVTAWDIRADAREQAASLGAKIGGFEVPDEVAIAEGGYAKLLTGEWLAKEQEAIAPLVAESDIVILSALVPGEVAPTIVTKEMVESMKPGSIIVDVSIDQGGNCEVTVPGEQSVYDDVTIYGILNIPGSMPVDASWMYSKNMLAYIKNLFKNGIDAAPDYEDEIVAASLVTKDGEIVHAGTQHAMGL